MFRKLLNYCVTNVSSIGVYSLSLLRLSTENNLYFNFWSGNVLHQVCIGTGQRGILIPRKILSLVASFISLFETPPPCIGLVGLGERLSPCLSSSLPGHPRSLFINNFGEDEFERCLALPTAEIIERNYFRSILDFLLMKLRTAFDKDWLQSLPVLHKVLYNLSCSLQFFFFCTYFDLF